MLESGGGGNSVGIIDQFFSTVFSHAVDLLPDSYCANCTGLELICGNQVYAVGDLPGFIMQVVAQTDRITDGFSSVVDFDLDGDLDAIIASNDRPGGGIEIVVWDVQTPDLLMPPLLLNYPGQRPNPFFAPVAIGNLDGDGFPDLVIMVHDNENSTFRTMRILAYSGAGGSWTRLFDRYVHDRSSVAGCSLFDFDSDGRDEIVQRDDETLRIISGIDGSTLYEFQGGCQSNTGYEFPITIDIDNDREAEIVCGCEDGIHIYESDGIPWPGTRNLWNQYNYFNVNINDDLTVPIQQQQHHLPGDPGLNAFLRQVSFPLTTSPDLELSLTALDTCLPQNLLGIALRLCNTGDQPIDSLYVTAYEQDPVNGPASIVERFVRFFNLLPGQCTEVTFRIDPSGLGGLWFMANDDGSATRPFSLDSDFPGPAEECNFRNNLVALADLPAIKPTPILDLGPDREVCDNGVFTFEAPAGFLSYQWQDGSSDRRLTADLPGRYWLSVLDSCGNIQTDTVLVTVDPASIIDLGPDIALCVPDDILLQASGYDHYHWSPALFLDCDTCSTVIARPGRSITYTLTATTDNGCVGLDTIRIELTDSILTNERFVICPGDSVWVFDRYVSRSGTYERVFQNRFSCDSTHRIDIQVRDSLTTEESFSICPGDSVLALGIYLKAEGSYSRTYPRIGKCDSAHIVHLRWHPTYFEASEVELCEGDTAILWGQPVFAPGVYTRTLLSSQACDSVEQVTLQFVQTIEKLDSVRICEGDYYLFGTDTIRQAGRYSRTIVPLGSACDTLEVRVVGFWPVPQPFTEVWPACPGGFGGSILIDPGTDSLTYSLDGLNFRSAPAFNDLSGGQYTLYVKDPQNCIHEIPLSVEEEQAFAVRLPADTFVEPGQYVRLQAATDYMGMLNYTWSPLEELSCTDCPDPSLRVTKAASYILQALNEDGCSASDTIHIGLIEDAQVFIPNVFSPNGDNINDRLTVFAGSEVTNIRHFRIFNRWGALLFEQRNFLPNNPDSGWDGSFKGRLMNSGVYVFTAEVELTFGRTLHLSGDVTLIR